MLRGEVESIFKANVGGGDADNVVLRPVSLLEFLHCSVGISQPIFQAMP